MDEVHGIIFIRFAKVLVRFLCFHFFTYVVHAVSENHFKLGTWTGYEKAMGAPPPNPQPGTMSLDPISLACYMLDATQPGQAPN